MSSEESDDQDSSSSEDELLKETELWESSDSDGKGKKGKRKKKKPEKLDEAELKRRWTVRRGKSLTSQLDKNDKADDKRPSSTFFKKKKFDASMKSNQKLVKSFKNFCKGQGSRRFVKDNVHKILCRRYLSEISESICKSTLDPEHIPELVESCSVIHQYYEDFDEMLVEELDQEMNWVDPDDNLLGHVFFTIELFLVGLYDDEGKVLRFIKDFLLLNHHTELRIRFARTFLEIYGPQFTLLEVNSPYRKDTPFLACSLNKEEEENVECLLDDKYLKELTKLFTQFTQYLQKRMLKYIRKIEKKILKEKAGTKIVKKEKKKKKKKEKKEEGEEEGKEEKDSKPEQKGEEKEKEEEKKDDSEKVVEVEGSELEMKKEDEKKVEKEEETRPKEEGDGEGKEEESKGEVKETKEGEEDEGEEEEEVDENEGEGEDEMDVIRRWSRQIVLVGKEERQRKNKIIEMEGGVKKSLEDLKKMSDLTALPLPEGLEGRVEKILEDIEEFRKYLKDNRQSFRGKQFDPAEKKFYEKIPNIHNVLNHLERVKMSKEAKTSRAVETSSKPLSEILGSENEKNGNGNTPSPAPRGRSKFDLLLDKLPKSLEKQEQLDWCVSYCQYGPANHRRLVRKLFNVSRTSLELLPYYSRVVTILLPLYKEVSTMLVSDLLDQFNTLYEQKDPIKIETKVKNIRFLGELVKFRIVPPNIILDCLSACLDNFTSHNVNISCELLECCGRFLCFHRSHAFLARQLVARMMQLAEKKRLNQHFQNMIESAFFSCQIIKPETRDGRDREAPTIHRYIYHLLYSELTDDTKKKVFSRLRRLPWSDPALEDAFHYAAQNIANCEFERVHLVASVISGLLKWHPKIGVVVVDRVLDDIRSSMAGEIQLSYQKRYVDLKFFGELYNYKVISADLVIRVLYILIMYCPQTDSPANTFRIRLTCILLETVGPYLEGKFWNRKLDRFLLYFQRYILAKKIRLPVDLENNVGTTLKLIRKRLKWPKNLESADRKIERFEKKYGNRFLITPSQTKLFPIHLDGREDGDDEKEEDNDELEGEGEEEEEEEEEDVKDEDDDYSEHNLMDDMVREQRDKEMKRMRMYQVREENELDDLINQMISDPLGVTQLGGPQIVVNVKKKKKPMIRLGNSSELLKYIQEEEEKENEEKERRRGEDDDELDGEEEDYYSDEDEFYEDEDDEEEYHSDDEYDEGMKFKRRIMSRNEGTPSPPGMKKKRGMITVRRSKKEETEEEKKQKEKKKKEKSFMDPTKSQKFTLISKVKGKQHKGKVMFIPKDIFN